MRERLDHLDRPLDQDVGPTAVIPGDTADDDAEGKAEDDPDQPYGQRDARAVDDAREHVAAEPVGAEEKELAALGREEQVEIAENEPPVEVLVAAAQKADRLLVIRVRCVDPVQI